MSSIWGEGLRGSRPVAAVSLQAEILGRASIEGQQKPACPDPFRVGTSEALTLVSDRPGRSSDVSWRIPTLKGSGQPSWAVVSDLLGSGSGRATHKFRPPPTPVGGGWSKAGRGNSESSQRIRGPQARFEQVVFGLDWANARSSTVSPSRPVGAPSPKSETLARASIESLWWAAPPRLSPTLPEASSERALKIPTLKGSGHTGFGKLLGASVPRESRPTLKFRPPPTPVGGGWPKAGRGQSESSQRIRGPQARFEQVVFGLDWANAQPSTVSPSRPVGAPSPKSEILGRATIEGLWFPTLKGSGHPGWALFEAQTRWGVWL